MPSRAWREFFSSSYDELFYGMSDIFELWALRNWETRVIYMTRSMLTTQAVRGVRLEFDPLLRVFSVYLVEQGIWNFTKLIRNWLPKSKGLPTIVAQCWWSDEVVVLNRFNDRSSGNQSAIFDIRSESSDGEKKKSPSRLNLAYKRNFRQRVDWSILEKFNFLEKPPKIYLIYV